LSLLVKSDTVNAAMRNRLASAALALAVSAGLAQASTEDDRKTVAALDTEFQAAVKHHDAATIDRIQHPDMVLVLGDGRVFTKADHVQAAIDKKIQYEIQDEDPGTQTVRVLGDTAVVTARLWLKGTNEGAPFDRRLWFSDTYVRTPEGWKYFFGQASLKLPDEAAK
jgi:ketosteroid isomerase-like protein